MNDEIYDFYQHNADFKEYVEAYCKSRDLGLFEALAHIQVKNVAQYYKTKNADKVDEPIQLPTCDMR